ncbi:MAG: EamA family transporter [Sphingobacteriaceae bacterium]|nr:EamA family transporter [Sphingobacteriaceae bacterium]
MNNKAISWIILIVLSLVWGSSFMLMKQGLRAFTSDEVAGLRITIASAFMLPFLIRHYKIDLKKNLLGLLLMGVFGNLIPAFLFTKAETQISSSLTGMLNALTPMFTIIIGMIAFNHKISKHQIIGVLIGFVGAIALVALGDNENDQTKNIMYSLLVAAATLCYAISVNGIKAYLGHVNSLTATVWSFSLIGPVAAIYLFGFTDVVAHATQHPEGMRSLGFVSILAIVGSALSVVVYNTLIKLSGTVFAASCTYLIPIVAIGWGLFDGEVINLIQLLAVIVIIGGIWMINSSGKAKNT